MGLLSIGISIGLLILFIILTRLFGAWMLRINDVINQLKEINRKLDNISDKQGGLKPPHLNN